jgi:hypothetical protein
MLEADDEFIGIVHNDHVAIRRQPASDGLRLSVTTGEKQ